MPGDHMKERCLKWLVCPACNSPLQMESRLSEGNETVEGILRCLDQHVFPIIHGVPRMLLPPLSDSLLYLYPDFFKRHAEFSSTPEATENDRPCKKQETLDRFGFEWSHFSDYDCDNFTPFIEPLPRGFFNGKLGLDVGCGAGRHAKRASDLGAEVVAFDLSQAVDAAYSNNKGNPNVHIIQADIYHLPFRQGTFQFIYSLGVLHHLPEPEKGYQNLIPLLSKGGTLFVWLYAYAPRKVALEILRFVTQRLSNQNIRRAAYFCNLIDFGIFVNLYRLLLRLPSMGKCVAKGAPPRIKEYSEHGFKVAYTDWFDRLSAPITNYYEKNEVQGWLIRSNLCNTRLLPVSDSWWWLQGERDTARP